MFDILKLLSETPGPGGREDIVHNLLLNRWQSQVEKAWITPVGNLVARVGGSGPKLMLVGHGDEIGFAVKHISEDGFIYFTTGQREMSGKPDWRGIYFNPIGQPALIVGRDAPVSGIFATLTGHILTPEQRNKYPLDWNDLFVDIGLSSREEVESLGIRVGDRIIWDPPFKRVGNHCTGKAMDNRVALALLDELLRRLDVNELAYELYLGSTIQEESGLYGAQSINREVNCTYAIAIDVALSGDVPGVDQRDVSTYLGGGAVLIHKDLYGYNVPLTDAITDVAEANNLPLQHAVFSIYGSDAGALLREGVAVATLGVPCRYTHSPFETIDMNDMEATLDLLLKFLTTPA